MFNTYARIQFKLQLVHLPKECNVTKLSDAVHSSCSAIPLSFWMFQITRKECLVLAFTWLILHSGICSQRLVSRSVKTHLVTGQAEISVNLNAETSLKVPSDSTTDAHLPPLYIQHLYFLFFLISHILVLLLFDTLRTNLSLGAKLKDYLTILPIFNVLYCSCILLSLQMKSWSTAPSQQHLCKFPRQRELMLPIQFPVLRLSIVYE